MVDLFDVSITLWEGDALYNWNSFKGKTDGVTLGTVFYLAGESGWKRDAGLVKQAAEIDEINSDHFVSRDNGKTFVFRERHDETSGRQYLERMTTKDVVDFYRNLGQSHESYTRPRSSAR